MIKDLPMQFWVIIDHWPEEVQEVFVILEPSESSYPAVIHSTVIVIRNDNEFGGDVVNNFIFLVVRFSDGFPHSTAWL